MAERRQDAPPKPVIIIIPPFPSPFPSPLPMVPANGVNVA